MKFLKRALFVGFPFLGSFGLEINNSTSLDISLTGVYQYSEFSKELKGSTGKGSIANDIGLNIHPTSRDEFQLTLSFAAGNGLKKTFEKKGFLFMPNADDLEDDLKDINGRGRDYLLEAWYKHTFGGKNFSLSLTGGIIDATAYIDENAYANDELTQFMNDVFVNDPLAALPSYDLGAVAEVSFKNFSLTGLVINSKTDEGKNYDYFALEGGFSLKSSLGEGNYRIFYFRTTKDFPAKGENYDYLEGVGLSADQRLGQKEGLFARIGLNTHPKTGDLKSFYSAGTVVENPLNWKGELGAGFAYSQGNKALSSLKNAKTAEVYYKFPLREFVYLTFDLQWDRERFVSKTIQAFTFGIRINATF